MVFFTDLDNTVIYSYKHDIGPLKRNAEIYQGREISFITDKTYELLKQVRDRMLVVPTTTRTVEQYNRIDLGTGRFPYALVCNGGILLADGVREERWYRESLALVQKSSDEMGKAGILLEDEPRRTFELRYIEELFLFTKCEDSEAVVENLKARLDVSKVDVFCNGAKVYVLPVDLNKGSAVKRFMGRIGEGTSIAAGDSAFDIPMLQAADIGICPVGFTAAYGPAPALREMPGSRVFSEELLEECLKEAEAK